MKYIILLLIIFTFTLSILCVPNPADCYCRKMGYEVIPMKRDNGNEYSLCKLPNGLLVDSWAFFVGKCDGQEYSYCNIKGFTLERDSCFKEDGKYYKFCAYCVKRDSNNKVIEKIKMLDLLRLNKDTLTKNCTKIFPSLNR